MNIQQLQKTFQKHYPSIQKLPFKHIIATAIICIIVMYFIIPRREGQTNVIVKTVTDSLAIKKTIKDMQAIVDNQQGIIDKLMMKRQAATPVSGDVSKPPVSPIQPTPLPIAAKDSSKDANTVAKPPVLYSYDFPIAAWITKDQIKFLCVNPYLQYIESAYTKTYIFDRNTSDFEYALTPTNESTTLQGIKLNYVQRVFSFDGFYVGAEAALPREYALYGEFDFSFYERLSLSARFTTNPGIATCLAYKIF